MFWMLLVTAATFTQIIAMRNEKVTKKVMFSFGSCLKDILSFESLELKIYKEIEIILLRSCSCSSFFKMYHTYQIILD